MIRPQAARPAALVFALILALNWGKADATPRPPMIATQVQYAFAKAPATPLGQKMGSWRIRCTAADEGWSVAVVAYGQIYTTFSQPGYMMSGFMETSLPGTSAGRSIQIADQQLVLEDRVETRWWDRAHEVTFRGSANNSDVHTAIAAWALWDDQGTCEATFGDQDVTIMDAPPSNAFFVGPDGFTGGVFVQDGRTQAAVGRVFVAPTSGGPVWGSMSLGGHPSPGMLQGDGDRRAKLCYGWYCTVEAFENHLIVASVLAGENLGRGDPFSSLQVIHLPPIPEDALPPTRFPYDIPLPV